MKLNQSIAFVITTLAVHGCASAPRVLTVKSDPADAEVCLKGKHQNQVFKPAKNCIGATPFEADSVTLTDEAGRKRVVHFNELDADKEQFYVVVSRPGYAPQSVSVPGWDHFVTLREEVSKKEPASLPVALPTPVITKGSAKISSDPVGALVYVNDFLKGNTPYVLEGENGQTIRLKIEQTGYRTIERSITIESGKAMEINLALDKAMDRGFPVEEPEQAALAQ